jgi:hypothetical protein
VVFGEILGDIFVLLDYGCPYGLACPPNRSIAKFAFWCCAQPKTITQIIDLKRFFAFPHLPYWKANLRPRDLSK